MYKLRVSSKVCFDGGGVPSVTGELPEAGRARITKKRQGRMDDCSKA